MKKRTEVVETSIMGMLRLHNLAFIRFLDEPANLNYLEFRARFENYTDEELVKAFNREVGNRAYVEARGNYLAAIQDEFIERDIDFSEIGDEEELLLTKKVQLVAKKLLVVSGFDSDEIN